MTAMTNAPSLSPGWPPTPAQLALLVTTTHWNLADLAYDLPRGAATRDRLDTTAAALEALATLLRRHQPES